MIRRQAAIARRRFRVNVSSLTKKKTAALAPQGRELIDEIIRRMGPDPPPPEARGAAEAAGRRAAAGQGQVGEIEVPGRHGQGIQIADGCGRGVPERPPAPAPRDPREGGGIGRAASAEPLHQRRKSALALAEHDVVDLREVLQQVLPEVRGSHAAEHDYDPGIDPLRHPGDLDPAPAVGVQDRKPDDLRAFLPQGGFEFLRRGRAVVPVQHFDFMAARLQCGAHVEKAHGRRLNVFRVQPGVEKVGVDQENFHRDGKP